MHPTSYILPPTAKAQGGDPKTLPISQHAFSLVELSIVLVILGLLTGGILAGQSLIRAAELRAAGSEYDRYTAAIHTFRDKYLSLPGDMLNATAFWTTAAACPGTHTTPSTTAATCNGNGNGQIGDDALPSERFRFWQHLANAGIIEGSYTGVAASANVNHGSPSLNIPASKLGRGAWYIQSELAVTGDASKYDGEYRNNFRFGAPTTTAGPSSPLLKPEEAWNLDTKLDDGLPPTGRVRTFKSPGNPSCTTLDTMAAQYNLSSTATACSFILNSGF